MSIPFQLQQPGSPGYKLIQSKDEFNELKRRLRDAPVASFDYETFELTNDRWLEIEEKRRPNDYWNNHIAGCSFAVKEHEAFYMPIRHKQPTKLFTEGHLQELFNEIRPDCEFVAHNYAYEYAVTKMSMGSTLPGLARDTMIMAFTINENQYVGLKALTRKILGLEQPTYEAVTGGRPMCDLTGEEVRIYGSCDADVTFILFGIFKRRLIELGLWDYCINLDFNVIPILMDMQLDGSPFDMEEWNNQLSDAKKEAAVLEEEVYRLAGRQFSMTSYKQMREVLYGDLGLEITKKTDSAMQRGAPSANPIDDASTNIVALTNLWTVHPIIRPMVRLRKLQKRMSSFYNVYPNYVHPDTGNIHPSFSLITREDKGLSTGRLAGSKPNLTQIPKRGDGVVMRKMFVPHANLGHDAVAAFDWSQIELRVLAHCCKDPNMIEIYQKNDDIHWFTNRQIFGEDATKQLRTVVAKPTNFLIVYGGGADKLAETINKESAQADLPIRFTGLEAQGFINAYFRGFPGVKEYSTSQIYKARKRGYVTSVFGRRYNLQYINSRNAELRSKAERKAVNSVIQGSAAEIMKLSIINIWHEPQFQMWYQAGLVRVLFLIHDELVFSLNSSIWQPLKQLVLGHMKWVPPGFRVPLDSSYSTGPNFGTLTENGDLN